MEHDCGRIIGIRFTYAAMVTTTPFSTSREATTAHALVVHPSSPPIDEVIISAFQNN